MGCDRSLTEPALAPWVFQSTHPVWGATSNRYRFIMDIAFQSTHPVWGATKETTTTKNNIPCFNPRTPCGVRLSRPISAFHFSRFQSTHPVWGATLHLVITTVDEVVSIHAPRVGCDSLFLFLVISPFGFNPRTPCGVRHNFLQEKSGNVGFNPRTPCGVRHFEDR